MEKFQKFHGKNNSLVFIGGPVQLKVKTMLFMANKLIKYANLEIPWIINLAMIKIVVYY